jgi:flagellar hook-associated protein 3 FlgL
VRIPTHTFANLIAQHVARGQEQYETQQIRIASNKRFLRRSEETVPAAQTAELQQTRTLTEQTRKNLDFANAWTAAAESRLTAMGDATARIREIAVQGGDPTLSQQGRKGLVQELDGLIEDLLAQANATFEGAALFGGTNGESQPVSPTRNADGRVLGVTYATNADTPRSMRIDDASRLSYGSATTGPHSPFVDAADGRDLFQSLIDLRDELESGSTVQDSTMDALNTAFDGVSQQLVRTGMQSARLQSLKSQNQQTDVVQQDRLSDLADIDLAAAITRLKELEASLQASMRLATSISDLSIVNYI